MLAFRGAPINLISFVQNQQSFRKEPLIKNLITIYLCDVTHKKRNFYISIGVLYIYEEVDPVFII
jgi:hypothetical protein